MYPLRQFSFSTSNSLSLFAVNGETLPPGSFSCDYTSTTANDLGYIRDLTPNTDISLYTLLLLLPDHLYSSSCPLSNLPKYSFICCRTIFIHFVSSVV